MPLKEMIRDESTDITVIGEYLDALSDSEREVEILSLNKALQRTLYAKAESAAPLTVDHFAKMGGEGVAHQGRNTLPAFKRFAKVFAATDDGRLFGFNEGATRPLLGPGYFVAYPCTDHPEWLERGSLVVDYFLSPDGDVPADWPAVVSNDRGLQRFVYRHTRDFMRRVSRDASIGAAYKGEKSMGQFFVLLAPMDR